MANLPSIDQATGYVINIEKTWGIAVTEIVSAYQDATEGYTTVITKDNSWAVWFEGDDSLYGEA